MPRVSVIIPAYNAAATIAGTIDSVVGQSFHDFEIICVDDGSTDGTLAIIRQYADGVRLIEQANSGPAAARNNGARHSSGEYLAFLDADDVWTPQFLDRGVAALDADRSLSLVYCNCALADSEGVALDTSIVGKGFDHAPSLNELLTQLWPIMPSAAIVRRTAYDACGGYRDALKGASFRFEDVDFWIKMREQGPFGYIDEPLITWRFAWFPKQLKRLPDYSKGVARFRGVSAGALRRFGGAAGRCARAGAAQYPRDNWTQGVARRRSSARSCGVRARHPGRSVSAQKLFALDADVAAASAGAEPVGRQGAARSI